MGDAMKETLPTVEKETEKGEITVQSKDSLQADDLKYERGEENLSVQQEIKETVNADAMKEILPIVKKEREEGDIPVRSKDSVNAEELKYENLPVQQAIKEIVNADTIEEKLQIVEKESESKNSSHAHSIELKTEDSNKVETVQKEKEKVSKLEKEIEKEGNSVQSSNNLRADILYPKKEDTIAKKETMVKKKVEKEVVQSMDSVH